MDDKIAMHISRNVRFPPAFERPLRYCQLSPRVRHNLGPRSTGKPFVQCEYPRYTFLALSEIPREPISVSMSNPCDTSDLGRRTGYRSDKARCSGDFNSNLVVGKSGPSYRRCSHLHTLLVTNASWRHSTGCPKRKSVIKGRKS